MRNRVTVYIIMLLLLFMFAACNSVQTKPTNAEPADHGIMVPPLAFVTLDAEEVWSGNLGESRVVVYSSKKRDRRDEIVVLTKDNRPEFYKRIEYLDRGGNRTLDYVLMKIYEEGQGWRDVIIDRDNPYGLKFADKEYNDILKELHLGRKFRRRK